MLGVWHKGRLQWISKRAEGCYSRRVKCVMTVRVAVENLMLYILYEFFVGRSSSNPANHSQEPPLFSSDEYFHYVNAS